MKKNTNHTDDLGISVEPLSELIKPSPDHLLVELITESNEHIQGITRLNKGVESYCLVHAAGQYINSTDSAVTIGTQYCIKPGDYVLMAPGLSFQAFKLYGKDYSLVYKHQVQAVIDPKIIKEFSSDKQKQIATEKKIDIVN